MDVERIRAFLLSLPHVVETAQFGGLVFWIGDKAVGGKMFAWVKLEQTDNHPQVISYPAGPERFAELLEIDGLFPAPYLARIQWIAAESWRAFRTSEWEEQLRSAYDLTLAKLSSRTRTILTMPKTKQKLLIAERRKLLASKNVSRAILLQGSFVIGAKRRFPSGMTNKRKPRPRGSSYRPQPGSPGVL